MLRLFTILFLLFFSVNALAQTNTVSTVTSGTVTVDKTPPTASAPSVVINNSDVCKTAYSAGVQTQILGIASGVTVTDKNCERLKLARSLFGMGMKVAAVSTLCQDARIFDAMIMAGTPCPYKGKIGTEALADWEKNLQDVPDGAIALPLVPSSKIISASIVGMPLLSNTIRAFTVLILAFESTFPNFIKII